MPVPPIADNPCDSTAETIQDFQIIIDPSKCSLFRNKFQLNLKYLFSTFREKKLCMETLRAAFEYRNWKAGNNVTVKPQIQISRLVVTLYLLFCLLICLNKVKIISHFEITTC